MHSPGRPGPPVYAGLFCVTLATLMHEILLTRIFSVTMWYHFAFMAISIAMFGMTVGAIIVYLRPGTFSVENAPRQLARVTAAYAVSVVVSFLVYLEIPFTDVASVANILLLALSYAVVSVPFALSGIVVSVALTKFPGSVAKLYAADLLGAAAGCIALVGALEWTDGPTAVGVVAAIGAVGASVFSLAGSRPGFRVASALIASIAVGGTVWHTGRVHRQDPVLRLPIEHMAPTTAKIYERWNSYSRVHVVGDPDVALPAIGWGFSAWTPARKTLVRQLHMAIDVSAATVITHFDGDTSKLQFLKDDVTNFVHHLRRDADVLVVGVGGGRDVLSALAFDQKSIVGVEINENVLRATNEEFGDFSGHLDRHPKVSFVVDEARSYVARSDRLFDIIQVSLIDTWAATAAGAYVLSENSIYTVEAWEIFLRHLKPGGILSVSRWYYPKRPGEALRLLSLAREALAASGVSTPRDHVALVKNPHAGGPAGLMGNGVATILVSTLPFSDGDLARLELQASRLGFERLVTPQRAEDELFARLLGDGDLDALYASLDIDVTAPTDDRPFFFQMLRLRDVAGAFRNDKLDPNSFNQTAIRLLVVLLGIVSVLALLCILGPLAASVRRVSLRGTLPFLGFFFAIGLGFMFVEISQMQRMMVFLGHPTYALSVVLFTLLVGSGLGSLMAERLAGRLGAGRGLASLVGVVAVVAAFGLLTPWAIDGLAPEPTPVRIAASVGILLAMGLFMGMPFPLGMKFAAARHPEITPWLWGVNGAASVLCSVLAMAVSLFWSISASFWLGVLCYVGAVLSYRAATRGGSAGI